MVKLLRYTGAVVKCVQCYGSWNSVLGECFNILCVVRQGRVLSTVLFSVYIDNVVVNLRNSGYGLHIGSVFVGCSLCYLLTTLYCYPVAVMVCKN